MDEKSWTSLQVRIHLFYIILLKQSDFLNRIRFLVITKTLITVVKLALWKFAKRIQFWLLKLQYIVPLLKKFKCWWCVRDKKEIVDMNMSELQCICNIEWWGVNVDEWITWIKMLIFVSLIVNHEIHNYEIISPQWSLQEFYKMLVV